MIPTQTIVRTLSRAMASACLTGGATADESKGRPPNDLLVSVAEGLGSSWRMVGIHLGLTQANVSNIDGQPHKEPLDKAFEMLVCWRQRLRTHEDGFVGLETGLRESERHDLADIVKDYCRPTDPNEPEKPNLSSDDLLQNITGILQDEYAAHRFPSASHGGGKFELPELFTELELTKRGVVPTDFKTHMELLGLRSTDGEIEYKRILVRGPMGCGKTTLFKAISQDWSRKNSAPNSAASKYDLLFSLDLREVRSNDDLTDAVFDQLLTDDISVSRDSLRSYIRENNSRVAILLDGLDQLTCCGNRFSSRTIPEYFYKLITRKVLSKTLVIVASRTSTKKLSNVCQVVDVRGFCNEGVTSYVKKFFRRDEAKMQFLLDVVESYSLDLRDFATTPNICRALCELLPWLQSESADVDWFPKTLTDVYDSIFKEMMKRHLDDICIHENSPISYLVKNIIKSIDVAGLFPPFHNPVPIRHEQLGNFFHDVGKAALHGLLADRDKHNFEESDFSKDTLAIARSVGLLLKDEETSVVVRFCHRSMQEYCASKYYQSLGTAKQAEVIQELKDIDDDLINLYKFCCGGSKECTDLIMKMVVSKLAAEEASIGSSLTGRVALACLAEFHAQSFLRDLEPHFIQEGSVNIKYSSTGSRLLRDFCHVLTSAARHQDFRDKLQAVHSLNVTCGMNTQCIRRVTQMVGHLRRLQTVSLVNNSDQELVQLENIPNDKGVPMHPVCQLVSCLRNHHLSELTINNCGLNSMCLTSILRDLPDLQRLDLSTNPGIVWSELPEPRGPPEPPRLTTLKLRQCGLTEDGSESFVRFLQQQQHIVELDIDCNDLNTPGLAIIMDALSKMGGLKIVSAKRKLSDGMLLPQEEILNLLTGCTALKALNVNRWEPRDEEAGGELLEAASKLDDFQALVINERTVIVDELRSPQVYPSKEGEKSLF